MSIRLHIDRVVLEGIEVPHGSRAALRASIERELAQRIETNGLAQELRAGVALPSVSAPPIEIAHGTPAPRIGAAIAASVHAGIGGKP